MRATSVLPCEYIELQLRFARWLSHGDAASYPSAVLHGTNLFARFRLGSRAGAADNPEWQRYVAELCRRAGLDDQVEWTSQFFAQCQGRSASPPVSQPDKLTRGAFTGEVIGDVLRFHFVPELGGAVSPLDSSQIGLRRSELTSLVGQTFERHREIRSVRGMSWLYNTSGYRSLFPPEHVAAPRPRTGIVQFQGSSSWGQFLDHRGGVKTDLGRRFLDRLNTLDPTTPWRAFPLPSLWVESPIAVFVDHFNGRVD